MNHNLVQLKARCVNKSWAPAAILGHGCRFFRLYQIIIHLQPYSRRAQHLQHLLSPSDAFALLPSRIVIVVSFFQFLYLADMCLWLGHHVHIEGLTTERFSILTKTGRPSVEGTCELDEGITLGEKCE